MVPVADRETRELPAGCKKKECYGKLRLTRKGNPHVTWMISQLALSSFSRIAGGKKRTMPVCSPSMDRFDRITAAVNPSVYNPNCSAPIARATMILKTNRTAYSNRRPTKDRPPPLAAVSDILVQRLTRLRLVNKNLGFGRYRNRCFKLHNDQA